MEKQIFDMNIGNLIALATFLLTFLTIIIGGIWKAMIRITRVEDRQGDLEKDFKDYKEKSDEKFEKMFDLVRKIPAETIELMNEANKLNNNSS